MLRIFELAATRHPLGFQKHFQYCWSLIGSKNDKYWENKNKTKLSENKPLRCKLKQLEKVYKGINSLQYKTNWGQKLRRQIRTPKFIKFRPRPVQTGVKVSPFQRTQLKKVFKGQNRPSIRSREDRSVADKSGRQNPWRFVLGL